MRCEKLRVAGCALDSTAHLGGLRLDFASTGEGAVNFTHDCGTGLADDGIDCGRMKSTVVVVFLVMARARSSYELEGVIPESELVGAKSGQIGHVTTCFVNSAKSMPWCAAWESTIPNLTFIPTCT